MLTILEGPDGGGKTTFAGGLKSTVLTCTHGPYPGVEELAPLYLESIKLALKAPSPVVMDRSWLSEPIYGRAYRGGVDRVGVAHRRMLTRCALAAQGVVVLFLPPLEVCLEAWARRRGAEYLQDADALAEVYQLYEGLTVEQVGLPVVRHDYTVDDVLDLCEKIVAAQPPRNLGPGVGAFYPGVRLIVGDQVGLGNVGELLPLSSEGPAVEAPFVSFARQGCSAWLAERLEAAEVPERCLYWVNSRQQGGRQTSPDFLSQLRPSQVLALGSAASEWCHAAGLQSYVTAQHPQYWKRFHHHEPYPLLSLLREQP